MAKLAIHGHATRGREVIEILEMLGGKNKCGLNGESTSWLYGISESSSTIVSGSVFDGYATFTLEEFIEKYPYKVGDKVILRERLAMIEKMMWCESKNQVRYRIRIDTTGLSEWRYVDALCPYMQQGDITSDIMAKAADECLFGEQSKGKDMEATKWTTEWTLPDGYEFLGVEGEVINATKIVLKKKQSQYPKTVEDCLKVMGLTMNSLCNITGYKFSVLMKFQQLLICRDAYWKIAGDWKPDWKDDTAEKYTIITTDNDVELDCAFYRNRILAFPTEKMRDAFYENFKELIEECKELL